MSIIYYPSFLLMYSLLIREFVGGGLSFYYELDLLEVWGFACGSLKIKVVLGYSSVYG